MPVRNTCVHIILDHASSAIVQSLSEIVDVSVHQSMADIPGDNNDPKLLLQPTQPILFFTNNLPFANIEQALKPLVLNDYQKLKRQPVLFMVSKESQLDMSGLVCPLDDILPRESALEEIVFKINQLIERSDSEKKLKRDLKEASDIALLSMSHSSELGEISRFILASYNCMTFDDLFEELFNVMTFFALDCTALIAVDDTIKMASSGDVSEADKNLLLTHHRTKRISTLQNELIVSHKHSAIMLHSIQDHESARDGRLADNMAVLGNCFDARVIGIDNERKALEASRAKTMFLATMSHELRTPMNSVIGYTDRLIKKLDGRLSEREQQQLFSIRRNSSHLLALINDILDLSKIEVGKMEIHVEHTDVVVLLKNVFEQFIPLAKTNHLKFELSVPNEPVELSVDVKRFTQMVMNLVSNAIKYTKEGWVKVALIDVTDSAIGESVGITIQDSGIGISDENQKKLFANFMQIDTTLSRVANGSGLGLAISAFFAKRHHGRIHVESKLGEGSCFTLLLPRPNA